MDILMDNLVSLLISFVELFPCCCTKPNDDDEIKARDMTDGMVDINLDDEDKEINIIDDYIDKEITE